MKKTTLTLIITAFCLISINAQKKNNFEFGVHFGVPIVKTQDPEPGFEDYKEEYNFNLGLTVGYYIGITDKIKVGGLLGYDHFIINFDETDSMDYGDGDYYDDYYDVYDPSRNFDADGLGFILIGPSAKFFFADKFYGGLDIGYAYSTELDEGALFFRPRVSFSTNRIDLYVFYKGINIAEGKYYYDENFHLGSAGLGIMFKF